MLHINSVLKPKRRDAIKQQTSVLVTKLISAVFTASSMLQGCGYHLESTPGERMFATARPVRLVTVLKALVWPLEPAFAPFSK